MPPIKKYDKESVINDALEIAKYEGLKSINARYLAKRLGCSVQPIFHNFKNMESLKNEVYLRIYQKYQEYMLEASKKEKAYKEMGLAYIKFARDYPEFFKIIFMQETDCKPEEFISYDSLGNNVIEKGQVLTGFSYEEQKDFHVKVWIFTHGLACLVATKTIALNDEEIDKLLGETVLEMVKGRKSKNE